MLTAGSALVAFGAARGGLLGKLAAIGGGACAVQGFRGRLDSPMARTGTAEATVTIAAPAEVVQSFWLDLQQLAAAVPQIERVDVVDAQRSRWLVRLPGGVPLHWQARITQDDAPSRTLRWRTDGPCSIEHEGEVEFAPAPGDRGTEVRVRLSWRDPAGGLTDRLLRWLGGIAGHAPKDELRRGLQAIKQVLEAGELATADMQPAPSLQPSIEPTPA